MPLDIKVTRHSQALPEECKRPTSSEHNGEEREHAENLEEESSLTGHEATEINKSGASEEHNTTDDTTCCHEEVHIMDVYEREFGDLLYLRNKETIYQRFYNITIKRMVTKLNFLPKELIECRIQSIWKKLLARDPALRSRHESDVRAAKLLRSKKKPAKTSQKAAKLLRSKKKPAKTSQKAAKLLRSKKKPAKTSQRKVQKNARSSCKPLRRDSQKPECLTDSNDDDQGGLYHTPLLGFRSKRNNRRATEDRYMPLDIKVTRHSQALPEECKRPTSSEHNGEEREHAENLEEESSLTGHEATEINKSGASEEHNTTDDTTCCHEEDGSDHSSVCADLPPLLSRREVEFFESDNDEDLNHDADNYYEV
ncbi:uncharacterized protein LOC119436156 isoform X11 [Dermacentor silvarum]|uniref:uncharacterized protein LOC119436156 isoform X9 n=1 Tax=Dermacentor silvarum TaxID=543639 RepID=UPI0021014645|nr:uncharacterized protein LOC119436156 isoform X9 [Dermacentor silvarum]XP_049511748.1 uncharacterized protein LOC119436156 isoform X10 [Dermacentor silvarum]XP_049511752.1 uncharacterized protein LOC119436156 isoform X11 [Dermacentor silvarum]